MTVMKRYPDNYFGLAIVDPPYFLVQKKENFTDEKSVQSVLVDCMAKHQSGKFQIEIILMSYLEFQKIKSFGA
mgnify:CR=1 FL=1